MSASCSIEPDSRRSDSCGRLSSRCSTARLSWDRPITGTSSSLASCFRPRLISEISWTRLSLLLRPDALEQLEIIDHDHADALLPLEAAGAGAKRGDGQAGRVVDVERKRLQVRRGPGEVAEFLLADLAHAEVLGGDPRLLGEDAGGELVGRHFEAEQGDPRARRLATARSRPHCRAASAWRRQTAMLVASELLPMPGRPATMIRSDLCSPPIFEFRRFEAGRDPRQMPAAVERALGHLDRQLGRFGERLGLAFGAAFFGDLVELGLGPLDLRQRGDFLARIERAFDEVAADADQRAEQARDRKSGWRNRGRR